MRKQGIPLTASGVVFGHFRDSGRYLIQIQDGGCSSSHHHQNIGVSPPMGGGGASLLGSVLLVAIFGVPIAQLFVATTLGF